MRDSTGVLQYVESQLEPYSFGSVHNKRFRHVLNAQHWTISNPFSNGTGSRPVYRVVNIPL